MTHLNRNFERQMMIVYARGALELSREIRKRKKQLEVEIDPTKREILALGIKLDESELTLRKRRLAQWKKDPCGKPEDLFESVSQV